MGWREEPERTTPCSIVINSSNLFELTSKMVQAAKKPFRNKIIIFELKSQPRIRVIPFLFEFGKQVTAYF